MSFLEMVKKVHQIEKKTINNGFSEFSWANNLN